MAPWTAQKRPHFWKKKKPAEAEAVVAEGATTTTAAEAELSIGANTTAAHNNITSDSDAKEVQIVEKETVVAAIEEAARNSMAETNARALATAE